MFPGFEISFKDGKEGLHILFIFDPEVGRENYLKAFEIVMGGINPWHDNNLQLSNKRADEAFRELRAWWNRECSSIGTDRAWNYLVLAPHIDSSKGLLGSQKAQVLQPFSHGEISGLELGDNKLPDQTLSNRVWLQDGMHEYRQAFFILAMHTPLKISGADTLGLNWRRLTLKLCVKLSLQRILDYVLALSAVRTMNCMRLMIPITLHIHGFGR